MEHPDFQNISHKEDEIYARIEKTRNAMSFARYDYALTVTP